MKKRNSKIVLVCSCMAFGLAAAAFAGCDFKREETLFGEWTTTLEATCEETGLQTRVSFRPFRTRIARDSPARARLGGMGRSYRALVFGRGGKEARLQHLRKRGFRTDSRARARLGRVGHRGGADV